MEFNYSRARKIRSFQEILVRGVGLEPKCTSELFVCVEFMKPQEPVDARAWKYHTVHVELAKAKVTIGFLKGVRLRGQGY